MRFDIDCTRVINQCIKYVVYLHVLLIKYLLPPSDLNKEMQVEGINDYRRGKIKKMGKDNAGMPPNQLPSTC